MVEQRELFHIVEISGVERDRSLKEEPGRVEQHPYAEVGRSFDQLHDASPPENEFCRFMEMKLLGTCGEDPFSPDTDDLDTAVEIER